MAVGVTGASRARSRCRERIGLLAGSAAHPDETRQDAVAELKRAIGFGQWCWMVTDPDPLFAVQGIAEMNPAIWQYVPRLLFAEESDPFGVPGMLSGKGMAAALSAVTSGDLARSERWDECLRPVGIGDELAVECRDSYGCWGWLLPRRESGEPFFSADDVDLLAAVSLDLAVITRRIWSFQAPAASLPQAGVVILDDQLRFTSMTVTAREWLGPLTGPGHGSAELTIQCVAAYLLSGRRSSGAQSGSTRLRTAAGGWAVLDGSMLDGQARGQVAITLRAATPAEVFDLASRAFALTGRERQLARHVVGGRSTQQIAERLGITEYTVKDHLKSVFRKLDVRTRGDLVVHLPDEP